MDGKFGEASEAYVVSGYQVSNKDFEYFFDTMDDVNVFQKKHPDYTFSIVQTRTEMCDMDVDLDDDLVEYVERLAKSEGVSISNIIANALRLGIKHHK